MVDAAAAVQRQLDAYNSHDVDAFLSAYATDVTAIDGDGQTLFVGHEAMRTAYERLFADNPDLHAHVPTRLSSGDWVVDQEQVQVADGQMETLVAYQVVDGLIRRVVMLSSS
jgi:hypothetical protein